MDIGPVLALEALSTIMPGKSVPASSSRGEATDTSALYSTHFSFLFMVENCIL
jgi:hypothetical protein